MNNLRPKETIQKFLISTTSKFTGEYEIENLVIAHAWPNRKIPSEISMTENPLCRNAFVLAFETDPIDEKRVMLPDYSQTANMLCVYLSVLFGKRFDSHGPIEHVGMFCFPHLSGISSFCNPRLPFNNHRPRIDLGIELALGEISRIEKVLTNDVDSKFIKFFRSAGKFYLQALQTFENNPETAYLNLITCGEILSNYYEYDKEELIDDETKKILVLIESNLCNGMKISNQVKSKLLQVKRKFIKTISWLLKDIFFENTESLPVYSSLKKENILELIAAAYDLRSRYVHTGIDFGGWVSRENAEIQTGTPVVDDKEFQKILTKAPTFIGLERILRFCLLRFMQLNDITVDDRLKDISIGALSS